MLLREDPVGDDERLPTDGLVVQEVQDEDTIRAFIRAWRRRVSREYARSLLEDHSSDRHEQWFNSQ